MAQKVIVQFLDDMDGSEAVGTLEFTWQGETIQVDLNQEHMDEYNQVFGFLKSIGRVVGKRKRAPYGSKKGTSTVGKTQEMREWLRSKGHDVKDRGRVSADLVRLWERHQGEIKDPLVNLIEEGPRGEVKVLGEDDMREVAKSLKEKAAEPVKIPAKGKTTRKPAASRKKATTTTVKDAAPATAEMAAILAFKEPEASTTTRKRAAKTNTNKV